VNGRTFMSSPLTGENELDGTVHDLDLQNGHLQAQEQTICHGSSSGEQKASTSAGSPRVSLTRGSNNTVKKPTQFDRDNGDFILHFFVLQFFLEINILKFIKKLKKLEK